MGLACCGERLMAARGREQSENEKNELNKEEGH
jgi:hypothetical protein